jgi:hypothetical protein
MDTSSPEPNAIPLPENESERLEALRSYDILDTLPEKDFDSITLLASQITQSPVAMVSLVDESRQWFKSKVGTALKETPGRFHCASMRSGRMISTKFPTSWKIKPLQIIRW